MQQPRWLQPRALRAGEAPRETAPSLLPQLNTCGRLQQLLSARIDYASGRGRASAGDRQKVRFA